MIRGSHTRRWFAVLTVVLFTLPFFSCHGFFTDSVLTSIKVSPATVSLQINGTQQLTATGVNDDGTSTTLNDVTWSSSADTIATVGSSTGLVKAIANGSATITAKSGTVSGTATVNVGTSSGTLTITPPNQTVNAITTPQIQFTAMQGSTDVTRDAQWSASPAGVVTFSSPTIGLATVVGAGTTTITATVNNVSGTTQLTVQ